MAREEFHRPTIVALIRMIDASPAVLWSGKGGVKERLQSLLKEENPDE